MLRSTYQLVRELSERLLRVPALTRGYERKAPGALGDTLRWIDDAERIMSGHRLTAAARLAGLKARILAPSFEDDLRGGLRRKQLAIAVGLLHELQETVQVALEPHATKLRQARDLGRQLLQIVAQSGAIRFDPSEDLATLIDRIWALCVAHDQLKPIAAQLRALLSSDDIRLLLAEEIDPLDFLAPSEAR